MPTRFAPLAFARRFFAAPPEGLCFGPEYREDYPKLSDADADAILTKYLWRRPT